MKEIKENYLSIVQVELKDFGINELKVFLNSKGSIEVEEHAVDMAKFLEKSNWSRSDMKILVYTLDSGTLVFMPIARSHIEEIREKDGLYEELSSISKTVDTKLQEITKEYLSSLRELNDNKTLAERIPPYIVKKLQHTDSLSEIATWKVRVIIGNSIGTNGAKVGEMDSVGYTHLGINTGTIVPVARGDEHHQGHDLIHHLQEKGLIPEDTYYPIFHNGDYVNGNDPLALESFKTWRKLGGPNVVIKNSSRGYNNPIPFQLTMDDYIKASGQIKLEKGTLFPIGQELIDHLKKLSILCQEFRSSNRGEKQVYTQAVRLLRFYTQKVEQFETEFLKEIKIKVMEAEKIGGTAGLQKLEETIFGFDGLKNKLHQSLRKAMEPKAFSFNVESMTALFGDLDLANHELGSI